MLSVIVLYVSWEFIALSGALCAHHISTMCSVHFIPYCMNVLHCNKNPIFVFPGKKLCGLSHNFNICVSVRNLYIPRIDPQIFLQQNRQPILGIYKWMWNVGLRPHNSFSGNSCFKFSVLCLCSAVYWQCNTLAPLNHMEINRLG